MYSDHDEKWQRDKYLPIVLVLKKYIITPFSLRGKQRYIIEWHSMYPLYARRFVLNVGRIGGAQPIAVLRALTHLILTCEFPHDVFVHRMSSRHLLYISFMKNSLVHSHYGDSNWWSFEIQVSRSPTEPPTLSYKKKKKLIIQFDSFFIPLSWKHGTLYEYNNNISSRHFPCGMSRDILSSGTLR